MRTSRMIHKRPEDDLKRVLETQQTIRVTRLTGLVEPLIEKVEWQAAALADNVQTIRKLHDRAQRAEEQLKRARREISGYELETRIADNLKDEADWNG